MRRAEKQTLCFYLELKYGQCYDFVKNSFHQERMIWYSLIVPMVNERFKTATLYWTHPRKFPLFTYYYCCHIFFYVFFSDSLTEFILTGYSFFAGGRGGGGGGAVIKKTIYPPPPPPPPPPPVWSNPLSACWWSPTLWTCNIQRKPLQQCFHVLIKDNDWNP